MKQLVAVAMIISACGPTAPSDGGPCNAGDDAVCATSAAIFLCVQTGVTSQGNPSFNYATVKCPGGCSSALCNVTGSSVGDRCPDTTWEACGADGNILECRSSARWPVWSTKQQCANGCKQSPLVSSAAVCN